MDTSPLYSRFDRIALSGITLLTAALLGGYPLGLY
jgi:hypothetical protein